MKGRLTYFSFFIMISVLLTFSGSGVTDAAPKPGPKAKAPAIELGEIAQKLIADRKKIDIDEVIMKDFIKSWQRVNIIGVVRGTKKIQVLPGPGMPRKSAKNTLIHRLEYVKKGSKSFEFYVVLPEGEVYPDGDKLQITNAYIESNRGYGVKYGLRPVLIGGTIEQLPPD